MKFQKGNKVGPRFQPGVSGNPRGRPKRGAITMALIEQLSKDYGEGTETAAQMIAHALISRAVSGDVQAAREIADRVEGRARQALDIDMMTGDWREMAEAAGLTQQELADAAREFISDIADSSESDGTQTEG